MSNVTIVSFMNKLEEIDNEYKSSCLWLIMVVTVSSILIASHFPYFHTSDGNVQENELSVSLLHGTTKKKTTKEYFHNREWYP